MKCQIEIDLDNDAFQENEGAEIAKILRALAQQCENEGGPWNRILQDSNGNTVGTAYVKN
jgi:hypothetical protein